MERSVGIDFDFLVTFRQCESDGYIHCCKFVRDISEKGLHICFCSPEDIREIAESTRDIADPAIGNDFNSSNRPCSSQIKTR